ncbi:hypothetical protein DJ83_18080 [Halorubrum ezzemoulense]|uniref:Uncharacterized protein n=1 Tax=Halorubrum ezzemoulense TaxID=337243 RepID=A0A256ILJ2_HALEZ|nr:hypothetical protein DJ83_18080 [Halorubrum ezzemoulense]
MNGRAGLAVFVTTEPDDKQVINPRLAPWRERVEADSNLVVLVNLYVLLAVLSIGGIEIHFRIRRDLIAVGKRRCGGDCAATENNNGEYDGDGAVHAIRSSSGESLPACLFSSVSGYGTECVAVF